MSNNSSIMSSFDAPILYPEDYSPTFRPDTIPSLPDDTKTSGWSAVYLLFLIVLVTVCGNVLVCLAVRYEKKLRNSFNAFLVSLAVSDMLSAIFVMPMSIIMTSRGGYCRSNPSIRLIVTSSVHDSMITMCTDEIYQIKRTQKLK